MIDRDNCGKVGNKCAANYISCSAGKCSMVPAVQLSQPNIIWLAAINGSTEDKYFNVTLPFPITLYSRTTNNISISTSGVSLLL